jgi:hypothetical protein
VGSPEPKPLLLGVPSPRCFHRISAVLSRYSFLHFISSLREMYPGLGEG